MAIFVYPFYPYYESENTRRIFYRFVKGMVREFEAICDYYEFLEKVPFRIYREDSDFNLVLTSKSDALSFLQQYASSHEKAI